MISKPDTVTLSLWVTFSYIKVDRSNRIRIDPSTVGDDAEWMFISSLVRCQICINTRRRCKPHFHTMISFTLSECSSQLGARSQQIRVGAASHVARWRTMAMRRGRVKFWRNSKWTDQSDQSARSYREGRRSPKESTPSVMNESIHVSTVAVLTAEFDVGENRSTHACVEQSIYVAGSWH